MQSGLARGPRDASQFLISSRLMQCPGPCLIAGHLLVGLKTAFSIQGSVWKSPFPTFTCIYNEVLVSCRMNIETDYFRYFRLT